MPKTELTPIKPSLTRTSKPNIYSEIITVTPMLAKEYLSTQITNRKWRRDVVDRYKAEILQGTWRLNGQPIIFNEEKRLADGQHRLMAIIEANKPVDMLVVRGVPIGIETTLDMGKSRTLGDVFQMKGVRNAKLLSRTSKLLLIWTEKFDDLVKKRYFSKDILNVHPQRIYAFYKNNQMDIDRACSEFKKHTPIITACGAAVLAFVFSVLEKIDIEKCYAFVTSFTSGNIKKEWQYMVKMRDEFLARPPKMRLTEGERISFIFGMWNVIYNKSSVEEVESNTLNIPLELIK